MREDFQNFPESKNQSQVHLPILPKMSLQVLSSPVSSVKVLEQLVHNRAYESHSLMEFEHIVSPGFLVPPHDAAITAFGATTEETSGKVTIVASPIFLMISRRFILSTGDLKFSSSRFSLLKLSSVRNISSSVKLCFRLSSAKEVFPSQALKTIFAVSFRQNALFVVKS